MKFSFIGVLLFSVFTFDCFATAQMPDSIEINNVKYHLNTNPLDKYLTEIKWVRPENVSISSANWRGYLASWKIEAGNMLLEDVTILISENSSSDSRKTVSILNTLFPNKNGIIATWYSGALIVPYGKMTNYVHMGYGSSYEKYIILRVSKGVVIEHLNLSVAEFETYKRRKFQEFKESKKFKEDLESLMSGQHNLTEEQALDFMQSYYAEYYLSL